MVLMIDNYDSFTYNLVHYFAQLGQEVKVVRNDEIAVEEIATLKPDFICISPGPCSPAEAGISVATLQ
ncbi:MAG: glutamine amidotransferase-related protein, partial [Burkholderiales bacterium]